MRRADLDAQLRSCNQAISACHQEGLKAFAPSISGLERPVLLAFKVFLAL